MVQLSRVVSKIHRVRMTYHYKRNWRLFVETMKKVQPEIPKAYQAPGINIIDIEQEQRLLDRQYENYFEWEPDHPTFIQPITKGPGHPLYKEIPCRVFDHTCQLSEGIEHAQVLTKTLVTKGQPLLWTRLEQEVDSYRIPDEDERVRRYVMHSVRWDSAEELLPKRECKPAYIYPLYFGISLPRASETLTKNLLRLMQLTLAKSPSVLHRRVITNALSLAAFEPRSLNDQRVLLKINNDLMVTSNRLLPAFSSDEDVLKTADVELPSIYPLKYTLDLKEVNEYEWENRYPLTTDYPIRFPHTIFVSHCATNLVQWSLAQKHARAIVHCHGTLAALARQLYGESVEDLPRPLSIQCVLTDNGRKFTFYAYQLNTLKLNSAGGIKNQVWIDSRITTQQLEDEVITTEDPYAMFTLADQMEGLLGYQVYREKQRKPRYLMRTLNSYDPVVMRKLLALYSVDLESPIIAGAEMEPLLETKKQSVSV